MPQVKWSRADPAVIRQEGKEGDRGRNPGKQGTMGPRNKQGDGNRLLKETGARQGGSKSKPECRGRTSGGDPFPVAWPSLGTAQVY